MEEEPIVFTDEEIRVDDILQEFQYMHLPYALQGVSRKFAQLAKWTVHNTPRSPERTVGLRKLLEAKDCVVRAARRK